MSIVYKLIEVCQKQLAITYWNDMYEYNNVIINIKVYRGSWSKCIKNILNTVGFFSGYDVDF